MIGVIGAKGNMGKRYCAILAHLGVIYSEYDKGDDVPVHDAYIVATPTETHCEVIKLIAKYGKPILCEKPISKDPSELLEILDVCRIYGAKLEMINQYNFIGAGIGGGETYYNYFKHGSDGILWDCINIIGLAAGPCELREDSPIWECMINDFQLDISDMDHAYIMMVKHWIENPSDGTDYIRIAHKKVWELEWR